MGKPDKTSGWQDDRMSRFILSSPHLVILSLIIIAYLLIGLQYAALTPRWQVPDEPAHYNYIREIVETKSLPVLEEHEYLQDYLGELTALKFPPELSIDPLKYESWQPPLYYLLAAPIFLISNGGLLPLRLFSLLLGAGVIVFAYLAAREAVPDKPLVAVTAAGFIAFIPQHIAMMAGINNDSLSELLIAVGLWLTLRIHSRRSEISHWRFWILEFGLLGFVIGLAFVTKSHAYLLAPVAGIMLLLKWRDEGRGEWRAFARRAAIVFMPALIIGGWWWGRNLSVYGWPDFMASIRHDQVAAGQPRTKDWITQYGQTEVVRRFLETTFHSFWGQFGWMGVPMPEKYYWALGVFTAALVVGLVIRELRLEIKARTNQSLISSHYLLVTSAVLTLGLYLFYNLTYVQHQGRYLYPALVPISLAASLSLWAWGGVLQKAAAVMLSAAGAKYLWARQPSSQMRANRDASEKAEPETLRGFAAQSDIAWLVPLGALVGMAALSQFALYRFIIPALR